ncbi:MAG: protein of unknown function (DUF4335) [Candidatus Atelocyanobacterium thalassa isolate SIO64986]|uniref:DUF4335 domain-containing protein n=1 Tax=Candidatus Atelocyanobacterium thalassa isolate SIO64986 TaxID=1527444 RepID=A0A086CHI8_9CHRO|nr:MAG: protein of unknown function (DUF4335) [Candidatus Atelocyanobacterium thalassa isolate SIO64986]
MILLSNHLLQTFTPPTCTLKIWDKRSFLRRLQKPILLDDIEFELLFDDPKLLVEDQMSISGNHSQLRSLYDTVQSYIKRNLNYTSSFIISDNKQNSSIHCYSSINPNIKGSSKNNSKLDPYLFSDNLFTHNLVFGYLANNHTCSFITLNSCQLFDLLYALEKYIHNITKLTSRKETYFNSQSFTFNKKIITISIFIVFFVTGIKFNRTLKSKHVYKEKPVKSQKNILSFLDVVPPVPPLPKPSLPSPSLPPSLSEISTLSPPEEIIESILPLNKSNSLAIQSPLKNSSHSSFQENMLPIDENINENNANNSSNINPLSYSKTSSQYSRLPTPPILNKETLVARRVFKKTDKSDNFLHSEDKKMNKPSNTVAQLDEIQKYFQERWKPLENLEQAIEYRLIIENNGSLKKSIPLGHLAMVYRSQVEFPEIGSPFVSPLKTLHNQSIRLVLIPDGTVRALLE